MQDEATLSLSIVITAPKKTAWYRDENGHKEP
jgi:hypothetical protein